MRANKISPPRLEVGGGTLIEQSRELWRSGHRLLSGLSRWYAAEPHGRQNVRLPRKTSNPVAHPMLDEFDFRYLFGYCGLHRGGPDAQANRCTRPIALTQHRLLPTTYGPAPSAPAPSSGRPAASPAANAVGAGAASSNGFGTSARNAPARARSAGHPGCRARPARARHPRTRHRVPGARGALGAQQRRRDPHGILVASTPTSAASSAAATATLATRIATPSSVTRRAAT